MFVSGLIVDALHLFNDNLWDACISIVDDKYEIEGTRNQVLLKKDWIQRAKKFGRKYFKSLDDLTYCMKDVHLYHKWVKIEKQTKNLNIEPMLQVIKPEYIDIDTLGAISCHGGSCEIF